MPNNIIVKAPNAGQLGGKNPSFYTSHWMNVSSDGDIRSHSEGLEGVTVTKLAGAAGRYCILLPETSQIQTEAVVGSMQETIGGTHEYVIAVTTTLGNACNAAPDGFDIAVLTRIDGAASDGSFNLLIPGTPQDF